MANYNLEYKTISKDETGVSQSYAKKVVDSSALATLVTTLANDPNIEFFVLRKINPKPVKPAKEAKK